VETLKRLLLENPAVLERRYREREVVCEPSSPPFAVRLDGVSFGKRLRGLRDASEQAGPRRAC
jgi:hypothetical protein